MEREDRQQLRSICDQVSDWANRASAVVARRASAERDAAAAVAALCSGLVELRHEGSVAWRALPMRPDAAHPLRQIAEHTRLPGLEAHDHEALTKLTTDAVAALRAVRALTGARRLFAGGKKREAGQSAAQRLGQFHSVGLSRGIPGLLDRLEQQPGTADHFSVADALSPAVGLTHRVPELGRGSTLVPASSLAALPRSIDAIENALAHERRLRSNALAAGEAVRKAETRRLVSEMPVDRLKDATRDRLRFGPLTGAGITTVQSVLDHGGRLEHLPGIGATTATRMRGAAQTLWQTTFDEMPVRIDIKNRTSEVTALLSRLCAWDAMRKTASAAADLARASTLTPLVRSLEGRPSHIAIFRGTRAISDFADEVQAVMRRAELITGSGGVDRPSDPWVDFLSRPADYFAMLAELGFITEDEQKAHGDLPDDIIEAVRKLELDTEHLTASLRGYQSFGARFALVQRRVVIGDEMGLGKTVEALAVLTHLRAKGSHHAIVVCPAAVVTNWMREVSGKSRLRPHRVHGPGREAAARNWARNGGVAVTTFESLAWFSAHIGLVTDLGCVVVDEAHYIKNPAAVRTQRTTRLLDSADRAILLTGTPLENRIEEFRNLVGYLRPDLVVDANELAPRRFRRQVAPAYLRRNQEDVLTELPDLVEVDEWLPMTSEDAAVYRAAVSDGNFMAMRQAAMLRGAHSEKLQRLISIVEEAEENGRRVIVFSHFREVLAQVARALPGRVFGPLTGSVPAAARQQMVDQFSAARYGAVLVAQIIAGGVGLNIQAASVVIICEPQLKPTTEWQAIARARRMGQLESVQVHRLLSEEGVDRRITEILARKQQIFEDFARVSETAESAPEAFDVSEAALARQVIASERERLFAQQEAPSDQLGSGS